MKPELYVKRLREVLRRSMATGAAPTLPAGAALYWSWFRELSAARTWHASGPNPITHAEIHSWASVSGWPIKPRHVAIIRALDEVWIEHFHSKTKPAKDGTKTLPVRSKHPVSPALFDAAFG